MPLRLLARNFPVAPTAQDSDLDWLEELGQVEVDHTFGRSWARLTVGDWHEMRLIIWEQGATAAESLGALRRKVERLLDEGFVQLVVKEGRR